MPYAIPTDLILGAQPDIVVIFEAYGRNTFLRDPTFQARYKLIGSLESDAARDYRSKAMLIFTRIVQWSDD